MSVICPNLSNPDVAREFNELKEATSERAAYAIWSLNNGHGIDKAPNGAESNLFRRLLFKFNFVIRDAIKAKAKIYTKSFMLKFGNWADGSNKSKITLDEAGEPDLYKDEEIIDRFVDKLVLKHKPFRSSKKLNDYYDVGKEIEAFVRDLIGIDIKDDFYGDSKELIKEKVDFFVTNELHSKIKNRLLSLLDVYNNTEYFPVNQYLENLLRFLERMDLGALSEYDEQTRKDIEELFPKLFNHNPNTKTSSIFGLYKHALMSKSGHEYERIYNIANNQNIRRLAISQRIKKLRAIDLFFLKYPNAKTRIKNRLFNEIDRRFEFDDFVKRYHKDQYDKIPTEDIEKANNSYNADGTFKFLAATLVQKGNVYSAKDIINHIKQDKKWADVCNIILQSLDKLGDVRILGVNTNERGLGGFYDPEDHSVYINVESILYSETPEQTILHECIHAISSFELVKNPKLEKAFDNYVNEIRQLISLNLGSFLSFFTSEPYGFKNSHEFIAEFMSNSGLRDLLKKMKPVEDSKFTSIFYEVISKIAELLGFHKHTSAYDQAVSLVEKVILLQRDDFEFGIITTGEFNNVHDRQNGDRISFDKNGDIITISQINSSDEDSKSFVVGKIIDETKKDTEINILDVAQKAKKQWIETRQSAILNETQQKLAKAYGLKQEVGEDGRIRFVSDIKDEKHQLIIDFLDYISGDKEGYYDFNSKSTAAHHVIAISLTNGDPSTFSHELAHHYVRMFYKSKLVQLALRAVDKPGMTDEEREEALVDLITAKTSDSKFVSAVESQSFVQKFWAAFATMLYNVFGIENEAIRNALYSNITRAFILNEHQRVWNNKKAVFEMADKRMFKRSKSYRQKVSAAREEARKNKSQVEYEQIGNDGTQKAIKSIIQGSVSRNKNFRKNDIESSKILVEMQIAEDKVRKFAEEIKEYRKEYMLSIGSPAKPTNEQRRKSSMTSKELEANLNLITGFVEQAVSELYDLAERFASMESAKWAYYVSKEVVDPVTGDTTIEYLDASHLMDPDVSVTEVDFKLLSDISQNVLGFYDKTITELYNTIRSPQFKNLYGEDAQMKLLSQLTSVNTVATGGVRLLDMIRSLKGCYTDAITERLHQFVDRYVKENAKSLSDEQKEKLIFSTNTWLENQNAFGDIGVIETWLGLASNSKSSLIRIMQDLIDDMSQELSDEVNTKGFSLRLLRKAAIKSMPVYGSMSPFNIDKLLMERDADGFTGNFLTEVNEGKYYKDRSNFINGLLFGKGGIQDKLRDRLGDKDYELGVDENGEPIFPEGHDDIEREYLHDLNHWTDKHGVRRFTAAYYDKRIDMLSSVTRKAQTKIQNDINKILRACTIDGKIHTELLTSSQMRDLQLLYYRKTQLSNPFDMYGRKKPDGSEEALVAKELMAWNQWLSEHIKNKMDYDAFNAARAGAKDKDKFDRDNTYETINPAIWEEIGKLFPSATSTTIADLRQTRNKLLSIIKTKRGFVKPRIDQVIDMETGKIRPGYEEFWENLKHYDEVIENLKSGQSNSKWTAAQYNTYKSLMTSMPIMVDLPGGTQETLYVHLQKKIKARLEALYGKYDPRVDSELQREMEAFQYTIRGRNGSLSKKGPLSIFSMTQPPAKQVNLSTGLVDAIVKEPISAYSVVDVENSDPAYVDSRFIENSGKPIQPITDETARHGDVSYTNENYKKYIENGPEALRKYYFALMDTMKESYANIPFAGVYDGRLPQRGATTTLMFHRNNWWNIAKPLIYWFKRAFMVNESDTDINIDYELRPDGTRSMNIPVRYIRRLDDPTEINSDVLGSVISFFEMSVNYKNKSKLLPLFMTTIDKLEGTANYRNRQKTFLKGIVNRSFYERSRNFDVNEENLVTYTNKWAKRMLKWIPGLRMLTTTGLLALNWLAGLVAYLDPAVQLAVDAVSGKYIDLDDYIRGTAHMLGRLPAALFSAGKSVSYDKVSSGMVRFKLASSGSANFQDMDKSQLNRFLTSGILMLPFSLGEHTVNALVFCTIMCSYRYVYDDDTKTAQYMNKREYYEWALDKGMTMSQARVKFATLPNLFDAYHTDSKGEFVPKDNKYGKAITPEFEKRLGKRMRNRASVSNLIVPGNERTKIQSNILTAFTVVMRTFMLVGINERFRSLRDFQIPDDSPIDETKQSDTRSEYKKEFYADKGGYNFLTDEIEDGVVTGFFHIIGNLTGYLRYFWHTLRNSKHSKESKQFMKDNRIAETDVYAFNRILSEIAAIGILAITQIVFHNKMVDDGDDDKYWNQVIDHLLVRLAIVRYTWFDANTFMDIVNSITPSKSDVDKKLKFIDLLKDAYMGFKEHGTQWEDWEKVKTGGYKNTPKAFRDLLQTFSSLGLHNLYTSKSTEGVKAKTKWFKKMVWWDGYWHDATPGKKSTGKAIKYKDPLGGYDTLGPSNGLGGPESSAISYDLGGL